MLLFVFDNAAAETPVANLTSFGAILSKPGAFLALTSMSSFLSSSVAKICHGIAKWLMKKVRIPS